jgi:predicted acylesterase/phospholipase RssA
MPRRIFLHLYLMRVPILLLLVLGVLLPCAFSSPLFHALADLEDNQVWIVAFAATLLLSSTITCCFLVLLYGSERADGKREPAPPAAHVAAMPYRLPLAGWVVGILYIGGGALYLSFLYHVEQTMAGARLNTTGLATTFWLKAGLGTLFGSLFIVVIFVLDLLISDPRSAPQIEVFALPIAYIFRGVGWLAAIEQFLNDKNPLQAVGLGRVLARDNRLILWLVRILGPGYGKFDANGNPVEIYPGHRFAGFLATLCLLVYVWLGRGIYSQLTSDSNFPDAPLARDAVLLHVALLLILACWGLSAFCFFFDRFRVPVLIPIALIALVTSQFGPSDHSFHTIDRPPGSTLPTPADLLAKKKDRAILVAAAGGGIQSAAWTSQVLCGLKGEKDSPLDGNILAISGVSGGSVGTLFYLRCVENPGKEMEAVTAAEKSSLEAIAWGLAYPDLRRDLLPLESVVWPGADRGWALERALRKNVQLQPYDRPLSAAKLQETWPAVLFNSTEVNTGDPIVFSNSEFPEPPAATKGNHALHGFHQVYAGRDVLLETAVRMSAAFPFVSPVARPDINGKTEHFADGGYFDNSGLFTLTRWLKAALPNPPAADGKEASAAPKQKILILIIDAFPDSEWKGPTDTSHPWPYQLSAPVDTILGVRSEGAAVRDLADTAAVLQILSLRGYDAEALTVRYEPPAQVDGLPNPKTCPPKPPLTWRLTQVERACITERWDILKPQVITEMKGFFDKGPSKEPGIPGQARTKRVVNGPYVQWIMR